MARSTTGIKSGGSCSSNRTGSPTTRCHHRRGTAVRNASTNATTYASGSPATACSAIICGTDNGAKCHVLACRIHQRDTTRHPRRVDARPIVIVIGRAARVQVAALYRTVS
jgi:hypothetical protein